ncbi:MAG: VanZ family protein [Candidatus Cloacimonetes bacterium]|jgi:VanZ family protein|nr:VanZ family protein [Candidatus Cloacimonadota bacterium]MCK9185716.1 VanZ family protein [Candidatus Cloacimonadota bacterium]MCK9584416.1 VanZ family protein [Candidatus Cloacimonadota bacterium]
MKARHYFILMLLWMVLIWVLSSLPSDDLPALNIWGIDKLAHLGIYLIWGIWALLFLAKLKASTALVCFSFSLMLVLAALDEFHQCLIPGRQVSGYDLLANASGLVLAFILYFILKSRNSAV